MSLGPRYWRIAPIFLFLLITTTSRAVDVLRSAETMFFDPTDKSRVGIEVEFKGMMPEDAAKKAQAVVGGKIKPQEFTLQTNIIGHAADGKPIYGEVKLTKYLVEGSSVGTLVFKPELNQIDDVAKVDPKTQIVEMITEPVTYRETAAIDRVLTQLQGAGAKGTNPRTAVSTQVNLEMFGGKRDQVKMNEVLDLMRSYLRPEHKAQIDARMKVPAIRQPYVQGYSKGFTKRLLDASYRPTEREFFDDFFYRQSMELLGDKAAWTDSLTKVQARFWAEKNPIVPRVVKQNSLRVSSLLMWMFPEDKLTKFIEESGWAYARPLVEFREWNNQFVVSQPVREALGLKEAAKKYGYYDHDKLIQELTGMDADVLPKLRQKVQEAEKAGKPVSFRYYLGDPATAEKGLYKHHTHMAYQGEAVGFLDANRFGSQALVLPGESVVMHRRPYHQYSVVGKYNPGLVNANIAQALENKYTEFRFFNEFAPGSMADTELLARIAPSATGAKDPKAIVDALHKRFPKGWILKGTWDLGSEDGLVTSDFDVVGAIEKYRKSDFDAYHRKLLADKSLAHAAPEYLVSEMKAHPDYKGWKLSQMLLEHPEQAIAQHKVSIAREFRVEVIGGKVLGEGSTLDRYAYKYLTTGRAKEYKAPPKKQFTDVEKFAQNILDRLPENLRGMPMGMDVAILTDGSMILIESNPGGNSNFLYEEFYESVKAMTRYLNNYPDLVKAGKIPAGLTPEEQMKWLDKHFKSWQVKPAELYPGMKFLPDRIEDKEFVALVPESATYQVRAKGCTARALLRGLR